MRRSSPAETRRGRVGWKETQLTPLSCPSRTYFTVASVLPKMSPACGLLCWMLRWSICSSNEETVFCGAECFFRRPEQSQTLVLTNLQSKIWMGIIPNCLIERSRSNQIVLGMPCCTHNLQQSNSIIWRSYVVIVSGEDSQTVARLPIPDANCLVIGTQNPRQVIRMKLDRPHIIQMSTQRVQNMFEIPDLDFIVVSATCKHTSRGVKINGADRTIMFFKPIQQCSNPIVP